ncbi:uncharacterized protein LACBIDRAFT_313489 [Laccaria bicolor S238N-H82]|uniref:Predicted protein n=1 Tax=Laccaria bicolor (strain S238N-H82 / ATCC MYA-4686) TaxID=486041 RepID=B0D046_LACBS|nr:uncharacterized protein LACBIDRAFT_313489 [Laccaria bicolor S238N-H82]EDR11391.1 predicted protein [Laccaria bicolor S238N-H82]|eukprot:XP_001877288.1 predicted protein [Laccaria bicolor S238N-H82]
MIVTSYGMGYEDSVGQFDHQYNEQYGASLEPPNDGSELVIWSTNPNHQGLVAVIQDPHMHSETDVPLSTPLPLPVSTDPSKYFYTSPSAPLPASSCSTLSGWAFDYKYDETLHQQVHQPLTRRRQHQSRHGTKPLVGRHINISSTILISTLARTIGIG